MISIPIFWICVSLNLGTWLKWNHFFKWLKTWPSISRDYIKLFIKLNFIWSGSKTILLDLTNGVNFIYFLPAMYEFLTRHWFYYTYIYFTEKKIEKKRFKRSSKNRKYLKNLMWYIIYEGLIRILRSKVHKSRCITHQIQNGY